MCVTRVSKQFHLVCIDQYDRKFDPKKFNIYEIIYAHTYIHYNNLIVIIREFENLTFLLETTRDTYYTKEIILAKTTISFLYFQMILTLVPRFYFYHF